MNCDWITIRGMVVLCDGGVSCNCGDALGKKLIGDAKAQTLDEIWHSEKLNDLRRLMGENVVPRRCRGCPFLKDEPLAPVANYPVSLYFEPTIACVLRCPVCRKQNQNPLRYRKSARWHLDEFVRHVLPYVPHVREFIFYNYGEAFLNPDLPAILTEARKANPDMYMFTSSNGMVMSDKLIESLVLNKIDRVVLSIDGATQEAYEKYRKKGDLKKILQNVDRLNEFKKSRKSEKPVLHWRYILFNWNDSWDEMRKALQLAEEHHFDEFTWEITSQPPGAGSFRFVPGAPEYSRIERDIWGGSFQKNALLHKDEYKIGLLPDSDSLSCFSIKNRILSMKQRIIYKVKNHLL